jgi:hypothetical protein
MLGGSGAGGVTGESNPNGLAVSISTAGVITLGLYRSQVFFSSGITLTVDTWYAIAVTIAGASGLGSRLFMVYDYTAQGLTEAGAALTDATAYAAGTIGHAQINGWPGAAATYLDPATNPFYGDIACFGLFAETWDSTANDHFAQFYADPWALSRGAAYSSANADTPTAGSITAIGTAAGIQLSASRPATGTTGYTYQWYRATTSGFTPGVGNALSGATSTTLNHLDTTAVAGTPSFYKLIASDSQDPPKSVTYAQTQGVRTFIDRYLGLIGDSLLVSRVARHVARYFRAKNCRVGIINRAKGGTSTYNATVGDSWQASARQASTTLFDRALIAFIAAGVQDVFVQLGTNDLVSGRSANDYAGYISNIITDLLAGGISRVIIGAPPILYGTSVTEATQELARTYGAALAALDNGTTIRYAGNRTFEFTTSCRRDMDNLTIGSPTYVLHPLGSDQDDSVAGIIVASEIYDVIYDPLPTPAAVAASVWSDADSPVRTVTA